MKRFKFLVYAQQFTGDCMPIYPFYAIMFMEQGGLGVPQISLLFSLYAVVAVVSELPTGILADRFSRRSVMVAGALLQAVALSVWVVMPNLIGYAVGFMVWGFSSALNSGAFQAYLYDELKGMGQSTQFNKIYGRAESMVFIGAAFAYLGSIAIGTTNYTGLLVVSIVISLLSALFTASLPKEKKTLPHPEDAVRPKYLKQAFAEVRRSKIIARLVISTAVVTMLAETMDEYVPLYYNDIGIENNGIPILITIGVSLTALLAWMSHRFENHHVYFRLLLISLAGGLFLLTSYQGVAWAAFGMFMFMRFMWLSNLLFEANLQHHITSSTRATVASLPAFISGVLVIVSFAAYGGLAQLGGNLFAIRLLALFTIVTALALFFYWPKSIARRARKV